MTLNIAINGFGRIGRNVLRALYESGVEDIKIVAINDLSPTEDMAHLLEFDSVHGRFGHNVEVDGDAIKIGEDRIICTSLRDPKELPWKALKVDIAFECTGLFTSHEKASMHLEAGAKKVLISAPAGDADVTVVYGVNHDMISADHKIISNASCTTNCLAPMAKVLHQTVGIESGLMTTVHAYTNDQNILDASHKDMRRARAAALSMIPTSTGAAKAVGLVLPELQGKLDGFAIRVPTPNVSVVDLTFVPSNPTTVEDINNAMSAAASSALEGVLDVNEKPLVSIDFNHSSASSTFDATQTRVMEDGKLVKVLSWYDNEWGFSNRMIDVCRYMLENKLV